MMSCSETNRSHVVDDDKCETRSSILLNSTHDSTGAPGGGDTTPLKSLSSNQISMARLPSSESLNYSTGPGSPGPSGVAFRNPPDARPLFVHSSPNNYTIQDAYPGISTDSQKLDTSVLDKSVNKLSRKESYKVQRKHYCKEKKRVANEVATSLKDSSVVILADELKVRGTLKTWTKLWCILKPGLLLLYKSPKIKSNHWVGTILLNSCQVIERPSKKDGFCFKLFHSLEQSIWAPRGPEKETIGAVVQPLPTSYLIFRARSQAAGKCWLDALELAMRSSSVLVRSMSNKSGCESMSHETQWSEADYEKHFNEHDLNDGNQTDNGNMDHALSNVEVSDSESEVSLKEISTLYTVDATLPLETPYVQCLDDDFETISGEQTEELAEEHKSLIWYLVKQVRPGMDLSKVVLPTFILEPRSFLDKLSDSYFHADILSQAVLENDPFLRMQLVVKWYLSGFYKKPKGLKKPYNPILGETFRSYWQHPNGSRTFFIAEQVSHHPPVSAFYVTNRQDGFSTSGSILAKSKYYGNSTSAILDGTATISLLPRGEDYISNPPYAHCKGILVGTLSMELGGKVFIDCEKTGYKAEIEFKLKSFFGGAQDINQIVGRIKLGKETLATLSGYWDGRIMIKDRKTGLESIFFEPTPNVREARLKRYVVPIEEQKEFESVRLWKHVSDAIARDDQVAATEQKTILEEAQRNAAKERQEKGEEWEPKHFQIDSVTNTWIYKAADCRPWDINNDVYQYEYEYDILTKTKHPTPVIRTASIVSVDPQGPYRPTSASIIAPPRRQKLTKQNKSLSSEVRESSSADEFHSDSSAALKKPHTSDYKSLTLGMRRLENSYHDLLQQTTKMHEMLERIEVNQRMLLNRVKSNKTTTMTSQRPPTNSSNIDTILIVCAVVLVQYLFQWLFSSSPTKSIPD